VASRFEVAFQFLTAVPLFPARRFSQEELARSMAAFPLVGAALGTGLVAFHWVAGRFLPPLLEGVVLTGLLAWATGAFHLDGLADTVDGLAGGWTREQALEIMKDSRTGAVGAAALCLVLLAKAVGLGLLPPGERAWALVGVPVAGRGALVLVAYGSRYARSQPGLGTPYTDHLDGGTVARAVVWTLLACLPLGWKGLAGVAAVAAYARLVRRGFHRRWGGITGDVLGFSEETAEVLFLIVLHAVAS